MILGIVKNNVQKNKASNVTKECFKVMVKLVLLVNRMHLCKILCILVRKTALAIFMLLLEKNSATFHENQATFDKNWTTLKTLGYIQLKTCHTDDLTQHEEDFTQYLQHKSGSGDGSADRAFTSDARCSRFESSHQQSLYYLFTVCQLYWKDENKRKRDRDWPQFFLKKQILPLMNESK